MLIDDLWNKFEKLKCFYFNFKYQETHSNKVICGKTIFKVDS